MSYWWLGGEPDLTIQKDPYACSVQDKPYFPLQGWFEQAIEKITIPEDQVRVLERLGKRGNIVYALKYRSQFDFAFLSLRLHQLGLPSPSFAFDMHPYLWQPKWYATKALGYHLYQAVRNGGRPDPYSSGYYRQKIAEGKSGLLFLVGKRGYYNRAILVGNDPLEHLLEIQENLDRPIFVAPVALLYSRRPDKQRQGPLQAVLGQGDYPNPIQKWLSFMRGYSSAVLEIGEIRNLQEIVTELSPNVSERRKQIFHLRRSIVDSVDEVRRAIIGPTPKNKIEIKEIILHHPKLEAFMQRRSRSSKLEMWKVRKEADGYLDEIAANYSHWMAKVGERVLNWMWNNLFDGIEVDMEGLQKVKKAARTSTIIYVPCHKSHIDYLILSYILFHNNLFLPLVAAGKNLSFWPIGPLFRRGGAFFIRRSFKGQKFYAEVFSLYVKTLVQLGYNIEFFIEGGRSRTGKMVLPKLGLLSLLIQAVEEGFCEDLVFVPTSICYDRIPEEESYLKEITGGTKVDENIGQLVKARRLLKKRYGRVYVQFGAPISLQRYLERNHGKSQQLRPKERHAMYRDFGYRIINSINQVSIVTPQSLAAAAILTSARHGISLGEFNTVCRTFHDYLQICGVQLSKSLRNYDAVIEETLRDFERSKMIGKLKDEDDDLEEEVFTMDESKRLALEYYKNNLIHFLLPAAYVSTSILAQQTFRFSLAQILEDMEFMKNFFKFEFVYDKDISNEKMMEEVLDAFDRMGLLHHVGDGDQPYLLAHRGLRAASAFHEILRNYLEGYWLVLRAFRYLQKKPYSEKDFVKKVLSMGQKALKLQLIERPESVSKIIFSNALKYFLEKGVIEKKIDEKGQDIYTDIGNRPLIHHYSKEIARLLRSSHFTLQ